MTEELHTPGEPAPGPQSEDAHALAAQAGSSSPPFLTEEERHRLLVEWNRTEVDYSIDHCLHELFEAQVQRTPDAVAVVFEKEQLTYRELERRANQLAHYLQERGVGPEVLVGICLERSLAMPVALLGILKAGGAYVPLDPSYPAERLAFLMEDTRAPLVLTQGASGADLGRHGAEVICLNARADQIARTSTEQPVRAVTPDNLAYVLFTSGSTGRPKGVMVCHRSVCNYLLWKHSYIPLNETDRLLQNASLSFDDSVWEFFEPLMVGARLIMAAQDRLQDNAQLIRLICDQQITALCLIPSMLKLFLEEQGVERCTSLRRISTGGEVLPVEVQERFFAHLSAYLYNGYGPTEATIAATFWTCRRGCSHRSVPIGRPIANTQIYLLNSERQPVPVGEPGELYIGGAGLARGYLNRPELTAQRFIPNPFRDEPEARLYRTGDLARYLPDGTIEFLGRLDDQVKVRGFRIELGEVEAVLEQCPAIRQAVVVVREDVPGDKSLVAYVVARQEPPPSDKELRRFLKERLPEHMVPSTYVFLGELPLGVSGKVDRPALPAPGRSRPPLQESGVAPRSPAEERLADIWAQILGLEQVGIHDNFFDLGGHSLRATQVISHVRNAFGVEVPLGSLFEAPSVAALAKQIEQARRRHTRLLPVARDQALPLSFAQERLWFLDQWAASSPPFHIPMAIRLQGQLDTAALAQALKEIVRRHEALRTTFAATDGQPVQVIAATVTMDVQVTDLRKLPGADRQTEAWRLAAEEARQPFDLAVGPLLRARLLQREDQEHVLLLTMHHIISDGWSMGVLMRELAVMYEAFATGRPSPLADLTIQYADHALWQRQRLQGELLDRLLAYWKRQLHGAPALLELPMDRPRPALPSFQCGRQSLLLPLSLAEALRAVGRQERATLFMILLAAFQALIHRITGQDDILVGSPVGGRTEVETEELIGFFVNALVLRTDLSGQPSFRTLLTRVRRVALEALDHQELPFQKLVAELHLDRDPALLPLVRVFLNVQPIEEVQFNLPGLVMAYHEELEQPAPAPMFDMTLYAFERPDGILLKLNYNLDLFHGERIAEMLEQFRLLLTQATERPDDSIARFSLVTARARQRLPDPSQPLPLDPADQAVHARFSQQALRVPDQLALVDDRESLCYGEVERLSNQLAHWLRCAGLGPGRVVAIQVSAGHPQGRGGLSHSRSDLPGPPTGRLSACGETSRLATTASGGKTLGTGGPVGGAAGSALSLRALSWCRPAHGVHAG